ncbi:hypothetical protein GGI25_005476 [Coemansia spiralis]|uniref:RING-type E3 ubiquitin transferase n=2 Tax=Coemansia TaxID=4863 RepID=A0A9W8KW38_9FUNG|nr:hypothetical protein BX070DRAFT_250340 [Coemansia spiralis]KAJ1988072.1 hypothetical protein EDC05_005510 [Coemansia umbellata]KAJ2619544.1 hypothetical protein GGI26_005744 [Coemansia sp. RSA 1358]KAJ2671512.1 hypothetical protein GGI25_005476 [Coemansia spiralis]
MRLRLRLHLRFWRHFTRRAPVEEQPKKRKRYSLTVDEIEQAFPPSTMHSGDGSECVICLDSLDNSVRMLTCHHSFHADCIDPWLKCSATCPTCRRLLVSQTDE